LTCGFQGAIRGAILHARPGGRSRLSRRCWIPRARSRRRSGLVRDVRNARALFGRGPDIERVGTDLRGEHGRCRLHIYRSGTSGGHYIKIISAPVTGASFADGGLGPNTTYYYQIAAVDSAGQESPRTSPIAGTTGSQPVACDPYFGENFKHVAGFALARTSSGAKLKRWAAMTTWVTAWIPTVISSARGLLSIDCVSVRDGGKACMTIRGTGADVVKMPWTARWH
jgi:hypothetical protein